MLGGVLFGIATFRAGILPRWAGGLLAIGAAASRARRSPPAGSDFGSADRVSTDLAGICALV
jgi:hypothetical protein